MVGCCGQRGNDQNSQRDKKSAPNYTNNSNNRCMPGATAGNNRVKATSGPHDEDVCHGTGERRRDLLDQLKIFINEFDDKPCTVTPPQQGPNATRALGSYPEYLKKHCQSWMHPTPRAPLITSVQTHEIRASSDFDKMKSQTSEYLSFTDATPKPPVLTCDCVKRNGLQDQCPHPMCKPPTAKCTSNNPGPCCPPSMGLAGPEAVLGGSKGAGGPTESHGAYGGGQYQGSPVVNEYQDEYCPPSGNQYFQGQSPTPYTTTYRQDYQDYQMMPMGQGQQFNQQAMFMPPQHQPVMGAGVPQPPPGMKMVCICKAPPSDLPSGKKFLCCPVQQ